MSHPKDEIDEPLASERDLMLLDLLYGETEGDESAAALAADALPGDDPEAVRAELERDLEAFAGLRSLFAELPEEEPPPAITNKLMHAAALHAPKKAMATDDAENASRGGLWAWLSGLFQPIMMHPGLAAAASMVLIVAITGTVYMSGKKQFAEPEIVQPAGQPSGLPETPAVRPSSTTAAPNAPARELPAEKSAEQAVSESGEDQGEAEAAMQQIKPAEQPQMDAKLKAALDGLPSSDGAGRATRKRGKKSNSNLEKRASRDKAPRMARPYEGKLDEIGNVGSGAFGNDFQSATGGSRSQAAPGAVAPADDAAAEEGDADSVADIAVQAPASAPEPASRPKTRSPSKSASKAEAAKPAPTRGSTRRPAKKKSKKQAKRADESRSQVLSRIRSLHSEARSAAANGGCDTVREVGARILRLDRDYYRERFRKDSALAACFANK